MTRATSRDPRWLSSAFQRRVRTRRAYSRPTFGVLAGSVHRPTPNERNHNMGIGASIFLIAIGAILKWGVTAHVTAISIATIGVILMVVGVIGLILSMIALASTR